VLGRAAAIGTDRCIVADADGVVVVQRAEAERVLADAEKRIAHTSRMRA
jgi:regulator of RNase E activity RraA